jgi:hypothetical protein
VFDEVSPLPSKPDETHCPRPSGFWISKKYASVAELFVPASNNVNYTVANARANYRHKENRWRDFEAMRR